MSTPVRHPHLVRTLVAALLPIAVSCAEPPTPKGCNEGCGQGARCDVESGFCVVNGTPTVRLEHPIAGSLIVDRSITVDGQVGDDDAAATVEVSTDGKATWAKLTLSPDGRFKADLVIPALDGQALVVVVRARDADGLEATDEAIVLVDSVRPTCALLAPVDGQVLTSALAGEFEVVVGAADGSGIARVEVSVDEGLTFTEAPYTGSVAKLPWRLPDFDGVSRKVVARVRDVAGNSCEVSASVTIDDVAPRVEFRSPGENAVLGLSAGPEVGVDLAAEDGAGTLALELSVDDGATYAPVALDAGVGSFAWALPDHLNGTPVRLHARATDAAGNATDITRVVTVDQVAPTCAFTVPASRQVISKADGPSASVHWSVEDGSGGALATSEISFDDGATWNLGARSGADWTTAWPVPAADDGVAHTFRARGRDAAGNACAEAAVTVLVDQVGPALAIASPDDDAILGSVSSAAAIFGGTATDGSGATTVTLDFEDGVGPRPATSGAGAWSATVPLAIEDHVAHAVKVEARDAAGNRSQSVLHVWVDRVAPQVAMTAPGVGQKFNLATVPASGAVHGAWTVGDGDPGLTVEVDTGSGFVFTSGGGVEAQTSPTDDPATYSIAVRARDGAGNQTVASRTFYVDRVRPAVVAVSPADGTREVAPALPEGPSVTFSEPVTPVGGSSTPVLSLSPAPAAAAGTWTGNTFEMTGVGFDSIYTANLAAGTVQDAFGNPNSDSRAWRFATPVRLPAPGLVADVAALGNVTGFTASADEDGALWFAAEVAVAPNCAGQVLCKDMGSRKTVVGEISPATGAVTSYVTSSAIYSTAPARLRMTSSRTVSGHLDPYRRVALNSSVVGSAGVVARGGTWMATGVPGPQTDSSVKVAIPAEASPSESTASEPFGFVRTALERYTRSGNPATALSAGFAPTSVFVGPQQSGAAPAAWRSWLLVEERSNGELASSLMLCGASGACGFQPSPSWPPRTVGGSAAVPKLSVAVSSVGTATVSDAADGVNRKLECWKPGIGAGTSSVELAPVAQGLRVAPAFDGAMILGARKVATGLELMKRDTSGLCSSGWAPVKTVSAPTATYWEPVMLGTRPGLLYVVGTKVYLEY